MIKAKNIKIEPYLELLQWLYKRYKTDTIECTTDDFIIDIKIKKKK